MEENDLKRVMIFFYVQGIPGLRGHPGYPGDEGSMVNVLIYWVKGTVL